MYYLTFVKLKINIIHVLIKGPLCENTPTWWSTCSILKGFCSNQNSKLEHLLIGFKFYNMNILIIKKKYSMINMILKWYPIDIYVKKIVVFWTIWHGFCFIVFYLDPTLLFKKLIFKFYCNQKKKNLTSFPWTLVFYNTKTLYEAIITNGIIPSYSFSIKLHNWIWFLSCVLWHLRTIFCYQNYDLKKSIDLNVHSYVMKEKNYRTSWSY